MAEFSKRQHANPPRSGGMNLARPFKAGSLLPRVPRRVSDG